VRRIYVINPPKLFHTIMGFIRVILPAEMRDQVEILNDVKDLEKYIAPEWIPADLGGSGPEHGRSPLELEIAEHINGVLREAKGQGAGGGEHQVTPS